MVHEIQNIMVVTSGRADFGLLTRICDLLESDSRANLILASTGYHFNSELGNTIDEVRLKNYSQIIEVNLDINSDSIYSPSQFVSTAILKFTEIFQDRSVQKILVLGDRYEILGVSIAASLLGIPLAHIGGGEVTTGAFDEFIRHSITKMASVHFTGHPDYQRRVIQMGENPEVVFDVGSPGAENIEEMRMQLLSKIECEKILGTNLSRRNFLVTFHPETRSLEQTTNHLEEMLGALDRFEETNVIFSLPNADPNFLKFIEKINSFVEQKPDFRFIGVNFGQEVYFSLLQFVDVVIGNSSSGILEVPSFKIGTVNIGDRQNGRVRGESVIDVDPVKHEIINAIETALSSEFRLRSQKFKNPFFKINTAKNIVEILIASPWADNKKEFYDL